MHMIGHDAPSQEAIALAVEMQQSRLNKRRDLLTPQPTCANTNIQLALYAMDVVFPVPQHLRDRLGQTVGEPERHLEDGRSEAATEHRPVEDRALRPAGREDELMVLGGGLILAVAAAASYLPARAASRIDPSEALRYE